MDYTTESQYIENIMLQIIAHRGASKEAPENTLAAIKRALALKSHCVEIDVRLSKEGIPVLLHDEAIVQPSKADCAPLIHHLTLPEIQKIDVGRAFGQEFTGETIPTLADVLALDWNDTGLMIEIKECPQEPELVVKAVFQVLAAAKKLPPFLVLGSFSIDIVQEIARYQDQYPAMRVIGIVEEPDMVARFVAKKLRHLAIWHPLVTEDLMRALLSRNIDIWTFTVDDPNLAQLLITLGVSGIISNDPKLMLNCL